MNKIYSLAIASLFVGSLSAQKSNLKLDAKPTADASTTQSATEQLLKKAPGDVLWHEDFRNGLGGYDVVTTNVNAWTSASLGANDYTFVWKYDNAGPTGQYTTNVGTLESSSAANGWMLFDINAQTDIENNGGFITADAFIQTPAIDASTMPSAIGLEIEHWYRTCCSGSSHPVDIFVGYIDDTNGLTWIEKNSGNNSYNTYPEATGGNNVNVRLMGISDVTNLAKAQTDNSIYVRFYWNSALDASSSYYFWMLDDVKIVELEQNDARQDKIYAGDIYNDFDPYMIPQSQTQEMIVGSDITNIGGNDLTNVQLDVTITEDAVGQIYNGQTSGFTIPIGGEVFFVDDAAIAGTNYYHTTGVNTFNNGVHTIDINVTATADDDMSNNALSAKFEYSDFEYGHYNPHSVDIGSGLVNDGTASGTVASAYAIKADAVIYGLYVDFEDGATTVNTAGQYFAIQIWDADYAVILTETEYELTQEMIDAGTIGLKFDDALEVFTDDLIFAAVTAYGDGDLLLATDYDGDVDNSTAITRDGTNYGAAFDPYANLNFNPEACRENYFVYGSNLGTGCYNGIDDVKENSKNGLTLNQNTPNPATNSTNVAYSTTYTGSVTLQVVDITGKIITTVNEGTKSAGAYSLELNTAEFSNGVYFYTLTVGQNKLTNKMIVNK